MCMIMISFLFSLFSYDASRMRGDRILRGDLLLRHLVVVYDNDFFRILFLLSVRENVRLVWLVR